MRIFILMAALSVACAPGPSGGQTADLTAQLSTGGGVTLDDLWYSPVLDKLLVAVGNRGTIHLVTRTDGTVTTFGGFQDPLSVIDAAGRLVVVERGSSRLTVVDAASGEVLGGRTLSGFPDYVRYVAAKSELWVSEPFANRLEVLRLPTEAPFDPEHLAYVDTGDGAEGLTINEARGHAYTHLRGGKLGVISLAGRKLSAQWSIGCGGEHGIPEFDETRGLVFAGCSGTAEVVALRLADGSEAGRHRGVGGATVLAYAPELGHFYLRGDPGVPVQILGVSSEGAFSMLGTADAATNGHCARSDGHGALWVCDADAGRLLRFVDPYPRSL